MQSLPRFDAIIHLAGKVYDINFVKKLYLKSQVME